MRLPRPAIKDLKANCNHTDDSLPRTAGKLASAGCTHETRSEVGGSAVVARLLEAHEITGLPQGGKSRKNLAAMNVHAVVRRLAERGRTRENTQKQPTTTCRSLSLLHSLCRRGSMSDSSRRSVSVFVALYNSVALQAAVFFCCSTRLSRSHPRVW